MAFDAPAHNNETCSVKTAPPDSDLQDFEAIRRYAARGKLPWRRITDRRNERLVNEAIVSKEEAGDANGKPFPLHKNIFVKGKLYQELLFSRFANDIHHSATSSLYEMRPNESAFALLSLSQKLIFSFLLLAGGYCFATRPINTLIVLNAIATTYFICAIFFRLWLITVGAKTDTSETDIKLARDGLPTITILLPLYDDANLLPALSEAINALDYPAQKKDVKLLLEADDPKTIAEVKRLKLDDQFETIVVRTDHPKTKPKACNYGLRLARGELVVIYDAEDQPEPDQLLKAAAQFHNSDSRLACVQARLNYYNTDDNWLTRLFTLEYSLWFDWLLPALQQLNMPIPLGGTSNFFRTDILEKIGGWDPYNVTEDADLGLRLSRLGYRTEILDSTTFEEANSKIGNWIRQRSRWMKGYLQTWLVHMRQPAEFVSTTGWAGLLSVQLFLAGNVFSALINPILWVVFSAWLIAQPAIISAVFPGPLLYLNIFALVFGNLFFIFLMIMAPIKRGWYRLCLSGLTAPFYWLLTSIAGYKAVWQIFTRPHFWEKTDHLLSDVAVKKRKEALKKIKGRAGKIRQST